MKEIYSQQWRGSSIPDVKSGKAVFECSGEILELNLDSFSDYLQICGMLDAVIETTYYESKKDLKNKINRIIK